MTSRLPTSEQMDMERDLSGWVDFDAEKVTDYATDYAKILVSDTEIDEPTYEIARRNFFASVIVLAGRISMVEYLPSGYLPNTSTMILQSSAKSVEADARIDQLVRTSSWCVRQAGIFGSVLSHAGTPLPPDPMEFLISMHDQDGKYWYDLKKRVL